MGKRLSGKIALVTGGGSGIGRAVCQRFAREGARLAVADIDAEAARRTVAAIGDVALAIEMDVSQEVDWQAATKRTLSHFERLDILCNIAGIGRGGSIEEVTLEDWNAMVAVNLTGTLLGCKHGVKAIAGSGGRGAIVNMSSIGGLVGPADIAGYCATKGGVTVLTKSVAMHCAQKGYPLRCVAIHPGYVDTEMLDPVAELMGDRKALLDGMARLVPMGRVCTPEDIADAVLFAASDEAAMISGSSIVVDGAQLAGPPPAHFA